MTHKINKNIQLMFARMGSGGKRGGGPQTETAKCAENTGTKRNVALHNTTNTLALDNMIYS